MKTQDENRNITEYFWKRVDENPNCLFPLYSQAQTNTMLFFARHNWIKIGPRMEMVNPLTPQDIFGYKVILDGPKPTLWLLRRIINIIFRFDSDAHINKERWEEYVNRAAEARHKNDEA